MAQRKFGFQGPVTAKHSTRLASLRSTRIGRIISLTLIRDGPMVIFAMVVAMCSRRSGALAFGTRCVRRASGIGIEWEYGEKIAQEHIDEELRISDTARAIECLEPYASKERLRLFEKVLAGRTTRLRVAYERPSNPNNVWACLRTLDAFGVQYVDVVKDDEASATRRAMARGEQGVGSLFAVRGAGMKAALGAHKWLTLTQHASTAAMVSALKADGYVICATDLAPGAQSLYDWHPPDKLALVFGNEEVGISEEMRREVDCRLYLPMKGFAESLNLSVSTAAFLAHLAALDYLTPNLNHEDVELLRLEWLKKSVRAAKPILRRANLLC